MPSDRIPLFCNLLDQGARELGMSIEDYYANGDNVAEGQLRMREKYGHDNLWSLFYVGKEAELLGCRRIIFAKDGPPNVGEMIIRSYEDIHKLEVPNNISTHPAFQESLKCLRILRAEAEGKHPICAYITASMTLPAILMGMDAWMKLLLTGPAEVRDELLAKCSDFFHKEVAAYRNAGANVLVYSNPFGSTDFVSMKQFREFSLPWMEKDLTPVGTQDIVYYCGGARLNAVIDQVREKTGIPTYYLCPYDDIAEGKRILGGKALCAGVINDIMLLDWSRDQIRHEVKRIVDAGMPGGRFFFGTMVMPYKIPEENIRALIDSVCEFGSYSTSR
jgi:uroporphyrinogen decarboxylase